MLAFVVKYMLLIKYKYSIFASWLLFPWTLTEFQIPWDQLQAEECFSHWRVKLSAATWWPNMRPTPTWRIPALHLCFLFLFPGSQTSMNDSCESPSSSSSSSCPPLLTPTGSGPDAIGMFDMDSSDMALSSSSSQQNFDPRRHSFSEEELKPQPMIKKARKVLVPDNLKVRDQVRQQGVFMFWKLVWVVSDQ